MNEQELVRKLNSVGKSAFVNHFHTFRSYAEGQISKEKCIDLLVAQNVSNSAGAAIRTGNARQIFVAKKEREALELIVDSSRLDMSIIAKARNIS